MFRRRLKAYDRDANDGTSANSYLGQRRALSRNITSLRVPQRLYIPGSEVLLNAIDPVLLADHPENVKLWLPSALSPALRNIYCTNGLPQLEYRLRCAQATNALHDIRNLRRLFRLFVTKTRSHITNTQRTATRTRTLFDRVKIKLNQAVSTYRASRNAIVSLAPNEEFGPWKGSLLELQNDDVRGPGREESESASRFVQSWIWTTASNASMSVEDSDLQAALRVEWCRAQERAKRYEEEVELIAEEMRRTLATFEWIAKEWDAFAVSPPLGADDATTVEGIAAFAHKRAHIQREMVAVFLNDWYHPLEQLKPIPPWLKSYARPPETKRRRLISNVQLYHPNSDAPHTDLFDADEVTSDNVHDGFCDPVVEDVEDFVDY